MGIADSTTIIHHDISFSLLLKKSVQGPSTGLSLLQAVMVAADSSYVMATDSSENQILFFHSRTSLHSALTRKGSIWPRLTTDDGRAV